MDRARFAPSKRDIWTPGGTRFNATPFNFIQHANSHAQVSLLYTSKGTLDTVISTPWYPDRDYIIEYVKVNVTTAPTGTLVWDLLMGGNSIFVTTAERPQIKSGDLEGRKTTPSRQGLYESTKLQAQGVTLNAGGGPLVMTIGLTVVQ
jgi:hypothetical protein